LKPLSSGRVGYLLHHFASVIDVWSCLVWVAIQFAMILMDNFDG
jgi:hypothetical protein